MRWTRTLLALGLTAALAAPALGHGRASQPFPTGQWTLERRGDALVAERVIERVAGRAEAPVPDRSLRLAVRAAVVSQALLDAQRIRTSVRHGEVTLSGRCQDEQTELRTLRAISEIRFVDRIESRLDCE